MKFAPRRLFSLSLSALTALCAAGAAAFPLDPGALPEGKSSAVPKRAEAPRAVPANGIARGLVRVAPQRFRPLGRPGFVENVVFADPARARAYEAELKGEGTQTFERSDTCFATSAGFRLPDQHDPPPLEWDTFSADRFAGQSFTGDLGRSVVPVRAERWSEAGGTVRVETNEFWMDLRSGGTKLLRSSEQELSRVAAPFAGVAVFAARTGPDSVVFFVRRDLPSHPVRSGEPLMLFGGVPFAGSRSEALDVSQLRTTLEGDVHTSPCAFERVELMLRSDESGAGLTTPLEKPAKPLQGRKGGGGLFAKARPAERANVAFATVVGFDLEPATPDQTLSVFGFSGARHGTANVRIIVVNLGLARSASGPPVPTVSYRWLDGPRPMPF